MVTHLAFIAVVSLSMIGVRPTHSPTAAPGGHTFERGGVQNSTSRGTRLTYGGSCGWQGTGRIAHVQNSSRRASVVVTVRESYSSGRVRRSRTFSYYLEPGAEQRVGCTSGDTALEWRSFSIVGVRAR